MDKRNENDLQEAKIHLKQLGENPCLSWTSSGYEELDALSGGLVRGGVTLIGARPAMGKTSLILNMIERLSELDEGNILLFSPELSPREVTTRLFQISTLLEAESLIDGSLSTRSAIAACADFLEAKKANIKVVHLSNPTLQDMQAYCYATPDLRLVVMDELAYIDEYAQPWSEITTQVPMHRSISALKNIAMELNVPVICTAKLHRRLESRKDKRPRLSDLKEIGIPETLPDQILFLYRDHYYCCESDNKAELIVAKTAYGTTGTVELQWHSEVGVFD